MYEVVAVKDPKYIGGHYAVQNQFGRVIGCAFRLDYTQALYLAQELNAAYSEGQSMRDMVQAG